MLQQFLPFSNALSYSSQFDYPLTLDELWLWQVSSRQSQSKLKSLLNLLPSTIISNRTGYYFLPGRSDQVKTRHLRHLYSQKKWPIAVSVAQTLKHIPTISAVFVTGALCMNNSPKNDDIDLMIVTTPHTLWLTRLIVVLYLSLRSLRRPPSLPEHASPRVNNKICDNLYLDVTSLKLTTKNLYIAHEVLQAKLLWQNANVHKTFIVKNSWISRFLPVAYHQALKRSPSHPRSSTPSRHSWLLYPLNFALFLMQFIYMKPHMTSERIGLNYAFFHPRSFQKPTHSSH